MREDIMTEATIARQIARAGRNTIADALARAAARFRDQTALHFADRNWSFREIHEAAGRVATHLLEQGIRPGDRVAAYGRNSDAYLILYLACARGGFIHVPINYALVGRELDYILDNSGASALFVDPGLASKADEVLAKRGPLTIYGRLFDGERDVLVVARDTTINVPGDLGDGIDPEDLVQLLYTSGTTAAPKGAMMSHRALLAEYTSCIVELNLSGADRALAGLPLYHSAQMHVFTVPQFLVGATTWLIEAPLPDLCLELIEQHRITSFFALPTVWISLLRAKSFDDRDLTSLQYVYYGASIMPVPVLMELRERLPGASPYNCYGQSEIGPLATVLYPWEHNDRPASAGRPIYNVETRLVDDEMNDVAPGEQGEIVHRSPQLLSGYWDKPEATAEAFAGGWFHSGDVGVMDDEGYVTVVDRTKDIIKTGGTMVASREVEEVLFTHPAVHEVAVIALPHEKWVEAVTAVVVLREDASVTEAELVEFAKAELAAFKLPKAVVFVEELPRNTAGKILKRQLRDEHVGLFGSA
jgi:fatty-acyl-CoA synthase